MNSGKMKIEKFLLFMVVVLFVPLLAVGKGRVSISGYEPDYKGYKMEFYRYADAISEEKVVLASFIIAGDGSFQTSFELDETTYCLSDFDAYRASLFLVPGKNYTVIFPPQKKIPDSQKRNPFFKADNISFALKNEGEQELNRLIQNFETAYLKEESRYFNQIYHQKSKAAADSLQSRLQKLFPETGNQYFENYKFYRLAFAEFALHQGQTGDFVQKYFVRHQPNLQIPPCDKLFEQLFSNHFLFEANKVQGEKFKRLVAQSDLQGIEDYLVIQNKWDKNLGRLVILQAVNDAYFQGQFSQAGLVRLLDKIAASGWEADKKAIAVRLKNKLVYLSPGSNAPDFAMTDFSGKEHRLDEFGGKYLYLNFTRVSNPIARQHLDELKKFAPNFAGELQIINLIMPEEADKKELIIQQKWPGDFYVVDEKVADKYKVANFPTAYLVGKNGKLVWSPAPNPMDGFEQRFINLLKRNRVEELRNQSK